MLHFEPIRHSLADLAVNLNVLYARLFDLRLVEEFLWIEKDLVMEQDDKLAGEPFLDLFLRLADDVFVIGWIAHIENYRELIRLL